MGDATVGSVYLCMIYLEENNIVLRGDDLILLFWLQIEDIKLSLWWKSALPLMIVAPFTPGIQNAIA